MADEGDSDHADSVPEQNRRRNKRKIVMRIEYGQKNDSSSSSEDEAEISGGEKKKSCSRVALESDDDSMWEQDWHSDDGGKANRNDSKMDGNLSDSSSSSGRDKCPICLFSFTSQEVGKPENCDHKFCAICIEEWSKNVSTCPIDRKEFLKIICLKDYDTNTVTREISVEVTKKDEEIVIDANENDLTYCRICNRADREESMLLCDGCNQGYHMECLVPALEQVPAEFWYCDDCFASNEDEDPDDELALQEEIAELMDEVREYGIPETRLRIRTEVVHNSPRILRTRQSERIRDAILARTNRRAFREATREENTPTLDTVAMPGPSRMHTSVRIVRTSMNAESRPSSSAVARRQRLPTTRRTQRRRVNRKTVVVEYDVDQEDDKFAIKTTKKIYRKIKRRRRQTAKKNFRERCTRATAGETTLTGAEFSNQFSATNKLELCNDPTKDGLTLTRMRAGIPRLSITGSRNELEYYSSGGDDDDNENGNMDGDGAGGGGLMMATRSRFRGTNLTSLRRSKAGIIIPDWARPSTADVLGSIMNEQERWLTISNRKNIGKIKINRDGRLEYDGDDNELPVTTVAGTGVTEISADVRGSNSTTAATSYANESASAGTAAAAMGTNINSSGSSSNSTSNGNTTSNAIPVESTSTANGAVETTFPDIRTAAARKAPPTVPPNELRVPDDKTIPAEDSSDEDCPNFSVYSAETMALAKNISEPTEKGEATNRQEENDASDEEREEDLVQLDDDDEEDEGDSVEDTKPAAATEVENEKVHKKCELELHDEDESDWDELQNPSRDGAEEDESNKVAAEDGVALETKTGGQREGAEVENDETENQLNTESISEDEEMVMVVNEHSRRSLTPCLDEKNPEVDGEPSTEQKKSEDLELISDEEEAEQNTIKRRLIEERMDDKDKVAAGGVVQTAENADEFKRLSKTTKVRNYRDKDRRSSGSSPPRKEKKPQRPKDDGRREGREATGRGSSPSRANRSRRKDLERYDVRNIIAERKQRPDKYGRTKHRRSRSRSNSSSLSSLSPDETRRSRSRSRRRRSRSWSLRRHRSSRSPLHGGANAGRAAGRGAGPARRKHSRSPRKRRSVSRFTISPSVSRSPSPVVRTSRRDVTPPLRLKNGSGGENKKSRDQFSTAKRRSRSPQPQSSKSGGGVKRRYRQSGSGSSAASGNSPSNSQYVEPRSGVKSWTPPLRTEDHLQVVVKNNISNKKEKKAKRKKTEKKRDTGGKRKKKHHQEQQQGHKSGTGKGSSVAPSKEVFASGDNILVSVNFSNSGKRAVSPPPVQTTIVTMPPSRDQIVTQKQRDKQREHRVRGEGAERSPQSKLHNASKTLIVTKNRRHRKVDAKPVAIIDLDGSPFRVVTPSPKAVIVLSDSDGGGGNAPSSINDRRTKKTKRNSADDEFKRKRHNTSPLPATKGSGVQKRSMNTTSNNSKAAKGTDNDIMVLGEEEEELEVEPSGPSNVNISSGIGTGPILGENSGPKTPPEPTMKFSMAMRSKTSVIRVANPLQDAREDEVEELDEERVEQKQQQQGQQQVELVSLNVSMSTTDVNSLDVTSAVDMNPASESANVVAGTTTGLHQSFGSSNHSSGSNKIGPNTPPEPAPNSPDVYDPFEPTKSNSASPQNDEEMSAGEKSRQIKIVTSPRHKDLRTLDDHKGKIPVSDLVMKLLNSTAGQHHHPPPHHMEHLGSLSPPPPPQHYMDKSLGGETNNSKGIQILTNVVIQPAKGSGESGDTPTKSMKHSTSFSSAMTMNSTTTSYSIMKQMQTEAKRMMHSKQKQATPSIVTTATATTCTPTLTQAMLKKHNAELTMRDIAAESPYSPGSSDFEDLFEPPTDSAAPTSRIPTLSVPSGPSPMKSGTAAGGSKTQAELFNSLFGSHSPPTQQSAWSGNKARKHGRPSAGGQSNAAANRRSSNRKYTALEDDVPDSAVDLVLKENYIKKLNRQERVVEEVKIVLRPHFRRKYITKDDYKEIMKKSVSKICNSRSGEINPQKIKAFIDAYVQKYRYRRKYGGGGSATAAGSSALVTGSSNSTSGAPTSSSNTLGNSGGGGGSTNQPIKNPPSTSTTSKSMRT